MSLNTFRKNKILAKISGFTVFCDVAFDVLSSFSNHLGKDQRAGGLTSNVFSLASLPVVG